MSGSNIRKITAGGEVQFFEPSGPSFVSLKAPALAADVPLTLPNALPGAGQTLPLVVDDAGLVSYGAALGTGFALQTGLDATQAEVDALEVVVAGLSGGSTFQLVYDAGEDVTFTAGKSMLFTQPLDEAVLKLLKTGAGAGTVLEIENDGTGTALDVKQDGAGSAAAVKITMAAGGSGFALDISHAGSAQSAVNVVQPGTGSGIVVNRTSTASTTGAALSVQDSAIGASQALQVAKIAGSAGPAVNVVQQNISAGIVVTQSSAGAGGVAAIFAKTGAASGTCVQITHAGNSGTALEVSTTNAVLVAEFTQGNNTYCVHVKNTMAGSTSPLLKFTSSATGRAYRDIEGTSVAWGVSRYGYGYFARLGLAASSPYTIATGVLTIFAANDGGVLFIETEGGAATDDLDTITMSYAPTGLPIIVLRPFDDTHTIVVKHATGNIQLHGRADFSMVSVHHRLVLLWDATISKWEEIGRGDNG